VTRFNWLLGQATTTATVVKNKCFTTGYATDQARQTTFKDQSKENKSLYGRPRRKICVKLCVNRVSGDRIVVMTWARN